MDTYPKQDIHLMVCAVELAKRAEAGGVLPLGAVLVRGSAIIACLAFTLYAILNYLSYTGTVSRVVEEQVMKLYSANYLAKFIGV